MMLRILPIVRRRWPIVVALVAVGAVTGLLIAPRSTPEVASYRAQAVVSASQAGANQTEVQQELVEARQGEVAATVADELGLASPTEVSNRVGADFDDESYIVTLTASGATPTEATELAEAFAAAFVASGNGGATVAQRAEIEDLETARDAAKLELDAFLIDNADGLGAGAEPILLSEQASLEGAYNRAELEVVEMMALIRPSDVYELINVTEPWAQAPSKLQALESTPFRVALGTLLGLVAAVLVVVIAERTNPRIDDPAEAEEIVGAPVLTMIPSVARRRRGALLRVHPDDFKGPYAEAFRTLRSHLDFRAAAEQRELRPRIMVTSATPSEGKSTTTAFLAMSFAETGASPLVIGGDLRRPSIHRLFEVERSPGLTSRVVAGDGKVPLTGIVKRDRVTGVTIVPSGPNVDGVTAVKADLIAISEVAQESGQTVILDTAPVRVANDAVDFLAAVDWVVIVVHAGRSTKRAVAQMVQDLRRNGAEVVGIAMIGTAEAADATRDYYSYYAPEPRARRERRRERPQLVAAS